MMLLFVWGRIRYDLVAVLALLAALRLGLVKPKDAFAGTVTSADFAPLPRVGALLIWRLSREVRRCCCRSPSP